MRNKIRGMFWIAILGAARVCAGMTATITSVNQTQAVLLEQGFSASCVINVSTSPTMVPLHPDVDPAKHSGANIDTSRADTLTTSTGTRIVTLGHQTDDRALAALTTYYYLITGCGGIVTGSFTTANISSGTTRTEQSPFNSTRWGNLGLPPFDWTTKNSYVDPLTGVTMIPMSLSAGTWRTGCGSAGCYPGSLAFTDWSGGSGWINPAGVLSGASTNAITGNTNPLDLYPDISSDPWPLPYDWHRTLQDVGVVVWGNASGSAAADRTIGICIFLNASTGCASNTLQVVLPNGSGVVHVSSGSADADGAFPPSFPSSPFYGWTNSVSPLIHMENRETFGSAKITGSTLTLTGISTAQHFSSALAAGQRIFVAGSGCPNNLCTVAAAPSSPDVLTVKETPWGGATSFRAYGWGIRVWKVNANGTAAIGLRYKLAGSGAPIGVQAGGDKCSSVAVTSGDGKTGYLCSLTSIVYGGVDLAFIATDGTTRILASQGTISFDDVLGNVFYSGQTNASGGWTVIKHTYTGNYKADVDYHYTCGPGGDCPPLLTNIESVDLMPHSSNADLDQQIEARQGTSLPAYNASLYGPWTAANGAVGYYGSSGHFAFFCNVYSGQGQAGAGGPGWCAAVDLSQTPAKVTRLIHTLDGTGISAARFGSLHTAGELDSYANGLGLGLDELTTNNPTVLFGGPFQAPVMSILMADGKWNSNTCLDWPPGAGSTCSNQSYYRTCPVGSSPFTECVTFRLPQNGVCNVAATKIEKSTWPCPWNPQYSQYPIMQAGDNAADLAGVGGYDSEHFRVLTTTPDTGNSLRVVVARNATYDYCSSNPWHGQTNPLAMQSPNQLQHANGWLFTMMPGHINACGAASLLQDAASGAYVELGRSFVMHAAMGAAANNGQNFVTSARTIFNAPFSNLGQVPPTFNESGQPSFHGNVANIGSDLQSYVDDSQRAAGPAGYSWALDMNPLVACVPEQLGCGPLRRLSRVSGSIYKIQPIGSAIPSSATYKTQPMIGWAGRFQLTDISGPGAMIGHSVAYSMCFALKPGECLAGSAANDVYVNVPTAYDPGYCSASLSWVSIPCVLFGDNAPAGGIRQFGIAAHDSNGAASRFVSNGWSSAGRHYPYTHTTAYPNGQWTMLMGTNAMDGFGMTGLMISLPPWQQSSTPDNDFQPIPVTISSGSPYAQVEFGYSRYIGPNSSPAQHLYCTARADNCETSSTPPFAFASEGAGASSCGSGCTLSIPAVGPNVLYYRVRRSSDGKTWTAGDVQAVAIP